MGLAHVGGWVPNTRRCLDSEEQRYLTHLNNESIDDYEQEHGARSLRSRSSTQHLRGGHLQKMVNVHHPWRSHQLIMVFLRALQSVNPMDYQEKCVQNPTELVIGKTKSSVGTKKTSALNPTEECEQLHSTLMSFFCMRRPCHEVTPAQGWHAQSNMCQ